MGKTMLRLAAERRAHGTALPQDQSLVRLLILTQYYAPEVGAPQTRLRAVVRQLLQSGHQAEVVTAMPNYPSGKIAPTYQGRLYLREEIDGVTVHRTWLL